MEIPTFKSPALISRGSMARYYIDLRDTQGMVIDDEGADFDHVEDALDEAKASARDLIKQYIDSGLSLDETCVEVRDSENRRVAALTVAEILIHPLHPAFKNRCSDVPKPGHH
jgi:hypothetical protein